jgi:signal peptidase I
MWIADYIGTYIIAAPFLILAAIGYWKLFVKAGYPGWAAFVPIYSSWVMLKISARPTWWLIWLFIPLVNFVFTVGIYIDFIRSYGKFKLIEQLAGFILGFICLPKWGFEKKTVYIGPSSSDEFKQEHRVYGRSTVYSRWVLTLFIIVGLSIFTRAFIGSTYHIPTISMERTLLEGDYILVSKIAYGPRMPITPVANPYSGAHVGLTSIRTYWDGIQLPYLRFPGLGNVERGDVIVFNYPLDTLDHPPTDEKETFIKRCVGIAGDTIYADNTRQFINGKAAYMPPGQEMEYIISTKGKTINPELYDQLHISIFEGEGDSSVTMTAASAKALRKYSFVSSITPNIHTKGVSDTGYAAIFPYAFPPQLKIGNNMPDYHWNVDNYGPIIIPKKGWTVKLDSLTFPLYERCIRVYEHNKVEIKGKAILINGIKTNTYTFNLNYYWVIGDNLHDSEDSRYWGFVPEDHVVGKAVLVYMSWDNKAPLFSKIRWNRMFTFIH